MCSNTRNLMESYEGESSLTLLERRDTFPLYTLQSHRLQPKSNNWVVHPYKEMWCSSFQRTSLYTTTINTTNI